MHACTPHTGANLEPPQMPLKRPASTSTSSSESTVGTASSGPKELQAAALREGFAEYQSAVRKHKESRSKTSAVSLRQFCEELVARDDRLQPLTAEAIRCKFRRIIRGKTEEGVLAVFWDVFA